MYLQKSEQTVESNKKGIIRQRGSYCQFPKLLGTTDIFCLHLKRSPDVDLYLNFEKSSWKNQVRRSGLLQTGFLACKKQV